MAEEGFKRKLAAILSADVEGYSRLMDDDEEATVRTLKTYRAAINDLVQQYRGRIVDSPGDNILAEFSSVVDAVNCAVEIQRELAERNAELAYNRKMEFRIGVNLGDVIEDDGNIYGDGVNIAARVESLTEAGGICISGRAYDQVSNKLGLEYENLGEHQVKNISVPIRVYRVLSYPGAAAHRVVQAKETLGRKWLKFAISAAVAVVIIGGLAYWQFYMRRPTVEPASVDKMAFPLPEKPSIAVLPFDNVSGDPKQEYISDGLTEEIITALAKVPKMFVIARNSTFTYKGKPVKVQQVAENLGVRYVLEGSVRKDKDKVRITAQLIDALTGHHLWAERYDRDLKDIFAVQDEITLKILSALEVRLTEGEQALLQKKGTNNLQVYLKLLQGNYYIEDVRPENVPKARRIFEDVISQEPNYASAYELLALTHYVDVLLGTTKSPKESLRKAAALAKKCLSIDAFHGPAYALLGHIIILKGDWDKGISLLNKAVELEPSGADSHGWLGLGLNFAGRPEEAIPIIKKALRLNPFASAGYFNAMAIAYRMIGQYDKAIEYLESGIQRNPDHFFAHLNLSACYILADREEEARAEAKEVLRINPNFSIDKFAKTLQLKNQEEKKKLIGALRKAFSAP
jgi:TolB-like protein/class 3 adenylate cyclase